MKTIVLYCHPWKGSFNHAILESVVQGLEAGKKDYEVVDLISEGFNPVLGEADLAVYSKGGFTDPKVGEYQKKLDSANELIIITPIWWGLPPAVLKGFFDKVLIKDWAYDTAPSGLLLGKLKQIKRCTLISTMNSPQFYYRLFLKSPLKHSLIDATLKACGVKKVKWFSLANVVKQKQSKREAWLEKLRGYATR